MVLSAGILFSVSMFGFIYLASTPAAAATYLLSFAGGISNVVLPCTLPLVFIIVPLAMIASGRNGLLMALLFGLGLVITLAAYGAVVAFAGEYLGLDQATRFMYGLAGIAALVFGLSELGLIKFHVPGYARMPQFIQQQGDYAKVFLLGLLLGNAGVGCPNPVTYAVFILLNGIFGHLWYEGGIFHEGLNAGFMSIGGKMIGEADIPVEEVEKPVLFAEYGAWINLLITIIPIFWYRRKYPEHKKEILVVLLLFLVWDLMLFDFDLNAMEWLGYE